MTEDKGEVRDEEKERKGRDLGIKGCNILSDLMDNESDEDGIPRAQPRQLQRRRGRRRREEKKEKEITATVASCLRTWAQGENKGLTVFCGVKGDQLNANWKSSSNMRRERSNWATS